MTVFPLNSAIKAVYEKFSSLILANLSSKILCILLEPKGNL